MHLFILLKSKIEKLYLMLMLIFVMGCSTSKVPVAEKPESWSQKVSVTGLSNLHQIDSDLYRSEQPNVQGMVSIESLGIKTVLNLRNARNDNREGKESRLSLKHIPINTWTMSYEDVVDALKAINQSEKPVLIHCLHGSDRTGCVVAAYRMANQGWSKEEAIDEFLNGGFGYHEKWFPNILNLLNSLDVEKLKADSEVVSQ